MKVKLLKKKLNAEIWTRRPRWRRTRRQKSHKNNLNTCIQLKTSTRNFFQPELSDKNHDLCHDDGTTAHDSTLELEKSIRKNLLRNCSKSEVKTVLSEEEINIIFRTNNYQSMSTLCASLDSKYLGFEDCSRCDSSSEKLINSTENRSSIDAIRQNSSITEEFTIYLKTLELSDVPDNFFNLEQSPKKCEIFVYVENKKFNSVSTSTTDITRCLCNCKKNTNPRYLRPVSFVKRVEQLSKNENNPQIGIPERLKGHKNLEMAYCEDKNKPEQSSVNIEMYIESSSESSSSSSTSLDEFKLQPSSYIHENNLENYEQSSLLKLYSSSFWSFISSPLSIQPLKLAKKLTH